MIEIDDILVITLALVLVAGSIVLLFLLGMDHNTLLLAVISMTIGLSTLAGMYKYIRDRYQI